MLKLTLPFLFLALVFSLPLAWGSGHYACENSKCGFWIFSGIDHDSIWHLAIASSAFTQLPFVNPVLAGESLSHYHFLFDLIVFLGAKLGIATELMFFKIIPFLYPIAMWGSLLFYYSQQPKQMQTHKYLFSLLFFVLLAGSFTFIPFNILRRNFSQAFHRYDSLALQPYSMFYNPQAGWSLIPIIILIAILPKFTFPRRRLLLNILLFVSFGLKFYAGATAVTIITIYEFLSQKKFYQKIVDLIIFSLVTIFSLYIFYGFNPFQSPREEVFRFAPFTNVHHIIEDSNLYHMNSLVLARYSLEKAKKFSPRLLTIELFSSALFIINHLGIRILGLIYIINIIIKRKITRLDIAILGGIVMTIFMTIMFIQPGIDGDGWYNTQQFFTYTILLMSLYAACYLAKNFNYLLVGLAILLALPGNIDTMLTPWKVPRNLVVSQTEIEALNFLKNQSEGTIFVANYKESNAYIPAFTGKPVYLADEQVLKVNKTNYKFRLENLNKLKVQDYEKLPVKYFYYKNNSNLPQSKKLKHIFKNKDVSIYEK